MFLNKLFRKNGFWSGRTGLEKALLAALGVCGMAMVAGGSYWAINNQNSPIEEDFNRGLFLSHNMLGYQYFKIEEKVKI